MKQLLLALILLAITNTPSSAQHEYTTAEFDPGSVMRDHPLDFKSMKLKVAFEPEEGLVIGNITHRFTPLRKTVDTFFLDGPGIEVKSARLNGENIEFKTTAAGITFYPKNTLRFGKNYSLNIKYDAHPKKGIYFIGWNDPNNLSRKQIWTQGQGIDNRHWFPCYDTPNDKLITEVIVTFPTAYKVLSNGELLERTNLEDGNTRWHYKMSKPHASYLVMLGIGKYSVRKTQSKSGVPLNQWYYPEWKDRYDFAYKYNEKIFNFLESEIGVPYGWESYSQIPVQDFMYGAMENTSATLFGDFFLVDGRSYNDRNYVAVNAHELAHQWFGDMITARSGNAHWLQESFATHYNITAERECFGQDHFDWTRKTYYNQAIAVDDKKAISHSGASSTIIYRKGAVVLQMLKYITGRKEFNRSIKRYLKAHKYENVDSDDLLNAFQDELGMALEYFWDEWVYRGGEPAYKVSHDDIISGGKRYTQFVVTQTHKRNEVTGLFKMPIAFEVHYKDGTTDRHTEWIENETHIIKVPNTGNKEIAFVLFDPNSEVLKTVSFDKPFEMLKEQALHAPHMLDRYDAIYAMRDMPVDRKRYTLTKAFNKGDFHAVKTEIVRQLLDDKESESLIKAALHDNDVQVRKGVIVNAKTIAPALKSDYETLLTDSSYVTITTALDKLCAVFPDDVQKYLDITKGIDGTKGSDVLVKRMELGAANNPADMSYVNKLAALTSDSYEFITRTNAMEALQRLNYCNATIVNNCINAALSSNGRLARPAMDAIKYFYAQHQYKKVIAEAIDNTAASEKEKSILVGLMK